MGHKEYYQARIETERITQNGLLKLGGLLLIGIIVFGDLYSERHDLPSLSITIALIVLFLVDLYWWVKINKKIHRLNEELLNYLKGA